MNQPNRPAPGGVQRVVMAEQPDAEAVRKVLEGDPEAFRLLVDRYARGLHRLAYRVTGSPDDAEDVVQETLIRAYRQLERFDFRSSLGTWLHRIALNCALDLVRSRQRKREESADEEELVSMSADEVNFVAPQEHAVRSSDIQQAVRKAMGSLTPRERTAFLLRHCEGMSIEEIGRKLGTRVSATKHTVFRAVQKLRQQLEPLV